ncbi:DUF4132 domain-containing protein [Pseudomonas turukhanskensis]|uniref:DUF4132 domain-containing protein n=1 Tax=Pseudomonas turukhanskensis TaxID=1806536 RepID=A0A9W6K506_9PSED|nr:DUF4132 domain-containing protein [Pseudomonas turukhanskensis]GLK89625.1 hypothetical protein GCM10017655_26870 [Pseudomonas turukhanskensis]
MIKHDEARYEAFATLVEGQNDTEFFPLLASAYQAVGIGVGLDFAALQTACEQGEMPPNEWRLALLAQTPVDLFPYQRSFTFNVVEWLNRRLFADAPCAAWVERGERLVMLLAPLLEGRYLASILWFHTDPAQPERFHDFAATVGARLRDWAQQLADGSGEWAAVHAWMRQAGADPARLLNAIPEDDQALTYEWATDLAGLRLLLIKVREQLLAGAPGDDHWIDLLLVNAWVGERWYHREPAAAENLHHHCCLPLLQVLADSPRLRVLAGQDGLTSDSPICRLFHTLDLASLFCQTPESFRALLDGMSDECLLWLAPSDEFVRLYPQAELIREQQVLARLGQLKPRLTTEEGLAWYEQVLEQLSGNTFNAVLELLMDKIGEQRLHPLITDVLLSRADQNYPYCLLDFIDNADWLYSYLAGDNPWLHRKAADRLFSVATTRDETDERADDDDDDVERPYRYIRHPYNWPLLLNASSNYPAVFVDTLRSYSLDRDDLSRWELIWNRLDSQDRVEMAQRVLGVGFHKYYGPAVLEMAARLYQQQREPWHAAVASEDGRILCREIAVIGPLDSPLQELLPAMAARYLMDSSGWMSGGVEEPLPSAYVTRALAAHPQAFAELEEKAQIKLLPLFNDAAVLACAAILASLFASSSKLLREPAVNLITRSSAATLDAANLLAAAPKARKLVLIGMALSSEVAMLELITRHFSDKAHDDYSRGLSLDALERGGQSLKGLDPWAGLDLASLQTQALGVKIPAAVSKYWNEEFAALLAPLGEALGLQLLHLLYSGGERLPRRARQLLSFLPAGQRSDFAWLGVRQWIASNGATELDWLLLALPVYGDERIANDLVKAIKDWKKARKQKASAAMRLLCQLPGNFGVAQVRDLWESGKFSESIESAAELALTEAGQRQGMTLAEFLEQLVPDFGMTQEGLVLDVGPYQYVVRMRPDLSLLVQDENGKTSKSLPKAKAGEDADKRSVAENQFKALAKNLKPVFKQQVKRLSRLFQLGSAWPSETWHKLFIQHPVMAVLAQAVVWSAEDAQGQPLKRFRPAEGGELIGLDDEPWRLPDDAVVHVTHPLELDEAERAAWVAHFADYQLESPIEQWTTQVLVPEAEILVAERLPLPTNKQLNRGKFASLVEKWGYIKGQAGDGARVNEHTWRADGGRWLVTLNHGDIDAYFDAEAKVSLDNIEVHRRGVKGFERQRLGDLPRAFLNTLLSQAQALEASAL